MLVQNTEEIGVILANYYKYIYLSFSFCLSVRKTFLYEKNYTILYVCKHIYNKVFMKTKYEKILNKAEVVLTMSLFFCKYFF